MSRPILFATIAAGGGHVATARAMAQAVVALEPAQAPRVSDFMREIGFEDEDRRHKESWRWLLARPSLLRAGQRVMDRIPRAVTALQRRLLDPVARRAAEVLATEAPSLVVANHGFLAVALTRAQQRYGLDLPVVVFATEPLDANALWAESSAERMVAPSRASKAYLVRSGVPSHRVDVVGYPVQQAFLDAPTRRAARAALGLGPGFTCLVTLGGEGVVRDPDAMLRSLLARGVQVVAVAGRNEELRTRLASMRPEAGDGDTRPGSGRLVVLGFTDRMPELLAAADVVVGKAGPASCMEALAVGRYLGLTSYAGLNERAVVRFVRARGVGEFLASPAALSAAVERWRAGLERTAPDGAASDEGRDGDLGGLRAAEARTSALDFPGMTRDVARYLLHYMKHRRPPAHWESRGLS